MSHRWNFWTVAVLSFVTFSLLVPNVCHAGLGKPLPVEDESSQAVTLDRLRDALLKESRIGGGDARDPQGPIIELFFLIVISIVLIGLLIAWASGGLNFGRPKGKWQIDKEKTSSGNTYFGVITSGYAAGMRVTYVNPVSAAQDAGMKVGDIITEFAGKKYTNENEFIKAISALETDKMVKVKVLRGGREIELKVKLRQRQ